MVISKEFPITLFWWANIFTGFSKTVSHVLSWGGSMEYILTSSFNVWIGLISGEYSDGVIDDVIDGVIDELSLSLNIPSFISLRIFKLICSKFIGSKSGIFTESGICEESNSK